MQNQGANLNPDALNQAMNSISAKLESDLKDNPAAMEQFVKMSQKVDATSVNSPSPSITKPNSPLRDIRISGQIPAQPPIQRPLQTPGLRRMIGAAQSAAAEVVEQPPHYPPPEPSNMHRLLLGAGLTLLIAVGGYLLYTQLAKKEAPDPHYQQYLKLKKQALKSKAKAK